MSNEVARYELGSLAEQMEYINPQGGRACRACIKANRYARYSA